MIKRAKATGRPTSVQASATTESFERPGFSRSLRSTFSTKTMAPSTSIPMAMARPPRDIRLAESPNLRMPRKARAMEKGMARATTTLARKPPVKSIRTAMTSTMPWPRAEVTVEIQASTRLFCS